MYDHTIVSKNIINPAKLTHTHTHTHTLVLSVYSNFANAKAKGNTAN